VCSIRDRYTNTGASTFLCGLFSTIGCLTAQQYALAAGTGYLTAALAYSNIKYNKWNSWYKKWEVTQS